jgi:hypothetical protein
MVYAFLYGSKQSVLILSVLNMALFSFCANSYPNCLRVDSINGAASDSVRLIFVLQLAQIIVEKWGHSGLMPIALQALMDIEKAEYPHYSLFPP